LGRYQKEYELVLDADVLEKSVLTDGKPTGLDLWSRKHGKKYCGGFCMWNRETKEVHV